MGVSVIPTFAPYIQTPEVRVKQQPLRTTRTNTAANGYVLGPFDTTEIPSAKVAVLSMVHLKEVPELRMSDHDRWPPLSEPPTLVNEDNLTTAIIKTLNVRPDIAYGLKMAGRVRIPTVYDIMLEKIRNRPVEEQYQAIIALRDAAATIASNIAKSNSGLVSVTKSSSEKEPADFAADVEASDLTTSVNDYYDTDKAPVNGMIPGSMVPMLGNTWTAYRRPPR
ncbi:hypothetical protein QIS74_02822 [Colletotrichum tabaci]|uniref:Uncharacterized protein n=1 Tax=Colletotrichum tabaci TaxID=1209068 RepID=A0AAV9TM24_9PEZI